MSETTHVAKLREGVIAWNNWRKENPNLRPDLSGIDLANDHSWKDSALYTTVEWPLDWGKGIVLDKINLSGADVRQAKLMRVHMMHADCSDADFSESDLTKAMLREAVAPRAKFWDAILREASLERVDLTSADFFVADLSDAYLRWAKLRDAGLFAAKLPGAILMQADLTGARMQNSDVTGADFTDCMLRYADVAWIRYQRPALKGNCLGVGGASEMFGDALFRRDVIDQDYLDTLAFRLSVSFPLPPWREARLLRRLWNAIPGADEVTYSVQQRVCKTAEERKRYAISWIKLLMSETKTAISMPLAWLASIPFVIFGGLTIRNMTIGALAALVLLAVIDPSLSCFNHDQTCTHSGQLHFAKAAVIEWLCAGTAVAGIGSGWLGRFLIFKVWAAFDYGRSWFRIIIFALTVIALFGLCYSFLNGTDVLLTKAHGTNHPFYPWFVATLAFATLGISDIAQPITGIGMLLMIGNVLAGFATLGLLLSVLANSFARRA